ncbi:MAG: 16S rRNA (guanine(527)-N(7))-methyltransferase RsmG [Bdellovibrionota bacterium]|jgi:16S rRNA (guanine527-N7)-methyltransferase
MDIHNLYQEHEAQFEAFSKLLKSANTRVNLMSREELSFLDSHILDSLLLTKEVQNSSAVIDLGSGGGFPIVPLSIALPNVSFTAIDSAQRKTDFLEMCKIKLSLLNLQIHHSTIENATALHGQFDAVTARALAALSSLLPLAAPFLRTDSKSKLVLLKGAHWKQEVEEARAVTEQLRLHLESVKEFSDIPGRQHSAVLTFSEQNA